MRIFLSVRLQEIFLLDVGLGVVMCMGGVVYFCSVHLRQIQYTPDSLTLLISLLDRPVQPAWNLPSHLLHCVWEVLALTFVLQAIQQSKGAVWSARLSDASLRAFAINSSMSAEWSAWLSGTSPNESAIRTSVCANWSVSLPVTSPSDSASESAI